MKENIVRVCVMLYNSKWFGITIMLTVGLLLSVFGLIYAETFKNEVNGEIFKNNNPSFYSFLVYVVPVFSMIGKLILTGGFFAFFLKSFQFAEVFRRELENVVLGKDYLTRTQKEHKIEVWKNVTFALCESNHEELKHRIANKIFDRVPFELGYYFTDMHYNYQFDLVEEDNVEYIRITEVINYNIISSKDVTILLTTYSGVTRKNDGIDKSRVSQYVYTVKGEKVLIHERLPVEKAMPDNEIYVKYKYETTVQGHDIYDISIYVESYQCTRSLVYWKANIDQFATGIDITFDDNDKLEIDLQSLSGKMNLQKRPFINTFELKDLIFPSDGFIFIIKKKD
jgi:hypothetical protein